MNYHSQIDQDRYFIEFVVRGRRGGRFLDVGSHDGVHYSNTLALERDYGWTGVCVEADPEVAELCRVNRPGSRVVAAAAWWRRERLTLSIPANGHRVLTRVAGLAGNDDYFADEFTETVDQVVAAIPLRELLTPDLNYFDYFSLDVEGAEFQALAGIDWATTTFGFVNIEHGHRPGMLEQLVEFMRRRDYHLHRVNFHDVEFTRPGFPVPPPARSAAGAATTAPGRDDPAGCDSPDSHFPDIRGQDS